MTPEAGPWGLGQLWIPDWVPSTGSQVFLLPLTCAEWASGAWPVAGRARSGLGWCGDPWACPLQRVLQWHQPNPGPAAAPAPTQRAGGLPRAAQREQPWGLLPVSYQVPLTLGWLLPRQCQPPTRLGPDSMHHLVGVAGGSGQAAAEMWPPSLCPPSLGPDQSPPLQHPHSSHRQPLPAEGPARPQPGGAAGLLQSPLEAATAL